MNELPQKMHLEKWLDIPGDILSHRENPQSLIPEHNRLGSMALVDLQSYNSVSDTLAPQKHGARTV